MNELSDQEIEDLLARHLGACLDGQVGRAASAFRREAQATRPRRPWRIGVWLGGAATLAAGFSIAWFLVHPHTPRNSNHPNNREIAITTPVDQTPPMLQYATWSKVVDDGMGLVDDRPVRRLHRKVVEEVEWYDSKSKAVIKATQPRQQVFLIGMETD
jgi:hypothetical protein